MPRIEVAADVLEETKAHSRLLEPMMIMMMMMTTTTTMVSIAGMDVSEKKNCFPNRDPNHGFPACSGSRCRAAMYSKSVSEVACPVVSV